MEEDQLYKKLFKFFNLQIYDFLLLKRISTSSTLTLLGSIQKHTFANFSEETVGLLKNLIPFFF